MRTSTGQQVCFNSTIQILKCGLKGTRGQWYHLPARARLRNDLYCVVWDVKPHYTILYYYVLG